MDKSRKFQLSYEQITYISNLLFDRYSYIEGCMYLGRIKRSELTIDRLRDLEHEEDMIDSILYELELLKDD